MTHRPRLLILGENLPGTDPRYRGTYRAHPYHCDALPDSHPANRLFFWFVQEGGELGIVHSLENARQLVRAYGRLDPPQNFDLVEVVQRGETPCVGTQWIGIDLSSDFNYSLLSWGLRGEEYVPSEWQPPESYKRVLPLVRLVEYYFRPRLNHNGLFDSEEEAAFCLDCMTSLQNCCPNLWEHEDMAFECVWLYLVSTEEVPIS